MTIRDFRIKEDTRKVYYPAGSKTFDKVYEKYNYFISNIKNDELDRLWEEAPNE